MGECMNKKINKEGNGRYPGIGYVGCEQLSGIYGVNGGIVDVKGTGLLHLFHKTYEIDLIHSACTMLRVGDHIYYGDKCEHKKDHQVHLQPIKTDVINGHILYDSFILENDTLVKEDYVSALGDNIIWFRTDITNQSDEAITVSAYAYANVNPFDENHAVSEKNQTSCDTGHSVISIEMKEDEGGCVGLDAPTGFLYGATQKLLYEEHTNQEVKCNNASIFLLREKSVEIKPSECVRVEWCLRVSDANTDRSPIDFDELRYEERAYWRDWFNKGDVRHLNERKDQTMINLAAMRSSCLNGFVPADLTGHYFANGMPCYYARDAMMVARSFMMAGYYDEFEAIMNYLIERKLKQNGEFYQRYNGKGEPDEGANNDVFHQLDSIGFFMYNIRHYYELTGVQLASQEMLKSLFHVLENSDSKNGLIGIEGGVNEGVYGPAYITSSNTFICGGLNEYLKYVSEAGLDDYIRRVEAMIQMIEKGIKSAYLPDEERYCYGYVDYHDDLIKKYDTPIYFGTLYGWKHHKEMENTHEHLKKHATYFDYGMGYSEQEYHHGPWLFNTGAAAQYAWLNSDKDYYLKAMRWMDTHSNSYGLMVEAVDADNEDNCFINPLTWACAEYVASSFVVLNESHIKSGISY